MKREGDKVKGGEGIALVGDAIDKDDKPLDKDDKPHLHFELWHKGNPVNPEQYVVF